VDFVVTFSFLTIAIKNRDKAAKLTIANVISTIEDSTSGRNRSSRDTMVRTANSAKAIDTNRILFSFVFLYAIRDRANSKKANNPLPKSNISAISPLSSESGASEYANAQEKFVANNIVTIREHNKVGNLDFNSRPNSSLFTKTPAHLGVWLVTSSLE
jgi:hypothetical protein